MHLAPGRCLAAVRSDHFGNYENEESDDNNRNHYKYRVYCNQGFSFNQDKRADNRVNCTTSGQ
jgi:hypothetical protein